MRRRCGHRLHVRPRPSITGSGYLTPISRALGFRTIFNVLGPLANPALVRRTLIGVSQAHLLDAMTHVLVARGIDHAILVNADDGLDELSLGSSSTLRVITPNGVDVQRLDAGAVLGLRHSATEIRGGDTRHNVDVTRAFLADSPDRSSTSCAPTRRWR